MALLASALHPAVATRPSWLVRWWASSPSVAPLLDKLVRGCRVEYDLIVLPELLDKPAGLPIANCSRGVPQYLADRAFAVDCGEDSLLNGIDGEGEVGVGVSPIDQDGHRAGGHPIAYAQGPRQTQRNASPPGVAVEPDRLALVQAIVAIGDEVVFGHGPTQQLDRSVLQWRRQRQETRGMRHPCDRPASRQIWSLLEPAPKAEATTLEPGIELRHGIGAILGVEQCVGERVGICEILCPPRYAGDWMVGGERTDRGAEVLQFLLRGADPE